MNFLRPFSTSARLTLLIASTYLLLLFVLGAGVYYKVSAQLEDDTRNFVMADAQELRSIHALNGDAVFLREVDSRSADPEDSDMFYSVLDARGVTLAGQTYPLPGVPAAKRWLSFRLTDAGRTRVIARTFRLGGMTLISGMQTRAEDGFLQAMLRAAWMSLVLAAALSVLTAWLISKWMNLRLMRLSDTAGLVASGQIGRRVDVDHSGDAFDRMGVEINHMLDRIEELIGGVRQVSDQIAHDLRTPLTHLRNDLVELKMDIAHGRLDAHGVDRSIAKTDQLLATFSAILRVSKLESEPLPPRLATVDLATLCADAAELYQPVAQEKGITIDLSLASATIQGERDQLFQMVVNLLDNAIKYSPVGSRVLVSTQSEGAGARVRVMDAGVGIPVSDRQRVFNRFERLETHRGTPGNGLGLSLVRAIVMRHGGTIALNDAHPGLCVDISLPAMPTPA